MAEVKAVGEGEAVVTAVGEGEAVVRARAAEGRAAAVRARAAEGRAAGVEEQEQHGGHSRCSRFRVGTMKTLPTGRRRRSS